MTGFRGSTAGKALLLGALVAVVALALGFTVSVMLMAAEGGPHFRAAVNAAVALLLAGGALAGWLALRVIRRRTDWARIETEQRLWMSGALGRVWLRARQRLLDGRAE